jgi:hypothetical protein
MFHSLRLQTLAVLSDSIINCNIYLPTYLSTYLSNYDNLHIYIYITIYIYVPIIPTNPFPFPAEPQCSRARAAQVAIRNFGGPPLGGDALDPLILDIPCPITMWGP